MKKLKTCCFKLFAATLLAIILVQVPISIIGTQGNIQQQMLLTTLLGQNTQAMQMTNGQELVDPPPFIELEFYVLPDGRNMFYATVNDVDGNNNPRPLVRIEVYFFSDTVPIFMAGEYPDLDPSVPDLPAVLDNHEFECELDGGVVFWVIARDSAGQETSNYLMIYIEPEEPNVCELLEELKQRVIDSDNECWREPADNRKNAMLNKIDDCIALCQSEEYEELTDKFTHDVMPKLTGQKIDGKEFKNAWVVCEELQGQFHDMIAEILDAI